MKGSEGAAEGGNNDAGDNRAVRNSNYIPVDNVIERPDQCDFHIKLAIVIFATQMELNWRTPKLIEILRSQTAQI